MKSGKNPDSKGPLQGLLDSEWMIVGGLLLIMASLVFIAKIQAMRTSVTLATHPLPSHEKCSVVIEGAVAKPGTFMVLPGTALKKILRKSSPKPFADLTKIDWDQRVEESMRINIEELREIVVSVEGLSSERMDLVVPAGTRVCDLKALIPMEKGSKKHIFKSRRLLKNGEVLSRS